MEKCCNNCGWWQQKEINKGLCKKRSPVVIASSGQTKMGQTQVQSFSLWPPTPADESCGDFRIRIVEPGEGN